MGEHRGGVWAVGTKVRDDLTHYEEHMLANVWDDDLTNDYLIA
jgi:hypothetical protein